MQLLTTLIYHTKVGAVYSEYYISPFMILCRDYLVETIGHSSKELRFQFYFYFSHYRHTPLNVFLIGLLNSFTILTGAWGLLFFDYFRTSEPDLTRVSLS